MRYLPAVSRLHGTVPVQGRQGSLSGASSVKHSLTAAETVGAKKPPDDWPRVRAAHLAKQPRCEKPGLAGHVCSSDVQVHHPVPRSAGGTRGPHGPLITLCRTLHEWVEKNRGKARQLGLLLRRDPTLKWPQP